MKKLFLSLAVCLACLGAMAIEPINIGVRGGISSNRIRLHDMKSAANNSEAAPGYMLGGFVRLNFGKFYVEPALQFSHKESVVRGKKHEQSARRPSHNLKLNTVDIPIMAGFRLINLSAVQIRTYMGPQISFGNVKGLHEVSQVAESIDRTNVRGKIGIGVDVWKMTFDVDYEKGFSKLSHELKSPRSFNFTVGFKII